MLNPALPLAVFDLIRRAVERAADRPEVDIPAGRKEIVASQVVRETRKLPEVQALEEATSPNSRWRSRGMIGALVAGSAAIAGAFGFVLAPEEIDAIVGLISNGMSSRVRSWPGSGARTPAGRSPKPCP